MPKRRTLKVRPRSPIWSEKRVCKRIIDLGPERGLFHLSFEMTPGKPGTLLLNLRLLLEDLL